LGVPPGNAAAVHDGAAAGLAGAARVGVAALAGAARVGVAALAGAAAFALPFGRYRPRSRCRFGRYRPRSRCRFGRCRPRSRCALAGAAGVPRCRLPLLPDMPLDPELAHSRLAPAARRSRRSSFTPQAYRNEQPQTGPRVIRFEDLRIGELAEPQNASF
jgi:hypothetical protein